MRTVSQYSFIALISLLPGAAFAQSADNVLSLVAQVGSISNDLISLVFKLALLFFIWGIAKFILSLGSGADPAEGRSIMVWGIIALFVMTSIWGIVGFLQNMVGIQGGGSAPVPGVEQDQ